MAKDTIELLKSSNAFIDPNLLALVAKEDRPSSTTNEPMSKSKRRRQRKEKQAKNNDLEANDAVGAKPTSNVEGFDSDEEEFQSLQPNRIVLKRASHVSDAEDSDDDE